MKQSLCYKVHNLQKYLNVANNKIDDLEDIFRTQQDQIDELYLQYNAEINNKINNLENIFITQQGQIEELYSKYNSEISKNQERIKYLEILSYGSKTKIIQQPTSLITLDLTNTPFVQRK